MQERILKSLFIFGAITLLTGCGEEAKTKEYYSQHLEEAKARVAECKKLEKMNETQQLDCTNAKSALFLFGGNNTNIYDTKSVNDNSSFKASDFVRKPAEDPYKQSTK